MLNVNTFNNTKDKCMGKPITNEKGFSAVEVIMVLVIIALIGTVGALVYKNQHKVKTSPVTATTVKPTTTTPTKTVTPPVDPYTGWKTYTSPLTNGLSFKYPASWSFTPSDSVFTNNSGGQENDVTVYSTLPTSKPGNGAPVSTNQFMCVSFDEYGGTWQYSNWNFGSLLSTERFQSSGSNIMLNTYKGDTPMEDQMLLITSPSASAGNQYIATKNNYVVSVTAQFNCVQSGFPAGSNLNADFNNQPETAIAKQIMKSIQL